MLPSTRILGSRIHTITLSDTMKQMAVWIDSSENPEQLHQIVATGFHGIWEACQDPQIYKVLNTAELWVPDGIAPVAIARLKGAGKIQRIPGAELMRAFFEMADKKGYRSFFYGDTEETLGNLRNRLEHDYPGHQVAGAFSPPFRPLTDEEDEAVIRMINDARPDVLWVGLGLPKQEKWIHAHRHRLKVPVAVGVGAAFAFISGDVKRVPAWIGDSGFEWVWRFLMEPRKLWRRDFIDGPRFLWHVVRELLREKTETASSLNKK